MKNKAHIAASVIATLCIATFLTSTLVVEIFGSLEAINTVKGLIVTPGLFILGPAIAITGASGFSLAQGRKGRLVESKKKRMPFIAVNGIFVLIPCAVVLSIWAEHGQFDTRFYVVQTLEILAGGLNLAWMGLNMRDGLKMTGKLRSPNN